MSVRFIAKRPFPIYVPPSKSIIESEPWSPTEEQKMLKSPCREELGSFDANSACFRSSEDVADMHLLEPFDFCQGNFEIPTKKAPCKSAPVREQLDPNTRARYFEMFETPSYDPDPMTPSYDQMTPSYDPTTPSYLLTSYNPMPPLMAPLSTASGRPSPSYDPWHKGETKLPAPKLAKQLRIVEEVEKVGGKKRKRWSKVPVVGCDVGCMFCVLEF